MTPLFDQICTFEPQDGDWRPLELLIEKSFQEPDPKEYYNAFFSVFERFTDDDGAGVMWSAVHGMESVGGYEKTLLHRFHKNPSFLGKVLLRRIEVDPGI